MTLRRRRLEVALDTPDAAVRAVAAGADRIELNAALALGGLVPSPGLAAVVTAAVPVPVVAMLRVRAGDFRVDERELAAMARDAELLAAAGVAGFAVGILDDAHRLDGRAIARLMRVAPRLEWVLHRAFDLVPDLDAALEAAVDLGLTRILTAGGAADAAAGAATLSRLVERAAGRIEILPGGGIRAANARAIVTATGADQVHGAFRRRDAGTASAAIAGLTDGVVALDEAEVAATRRALDAP